MNKLWECNIPTLIEKIKRSDISKSDNYIQSIHLTAFKKIARDSHLEFSFPLTVLVGKNGSSKSSVLQALYGAPHGKSCSDFWFSTKVDPIEEADGNAADRPRFDYTYFCDNQLKTAYKSRIQRDNDPDYWEPTRPKISDGAQTSQEREPPVRKNVVYIDFRAELSAFDIAYHFGFSKNNRETRKAELRNRSRYLKNLFETGSAKMPKRGNKAGKCSELSTEAVSIINWILGKSYSKILLAEHSIFSIFGTSILLQTNIGNGSYSEANAGSGEIAIVQLVNKLHQAKKGSLILLDEPETSIHPSAQKRLMQYLLYCISKQKHQIVLATHSSALIDQLPNEAFKLLQKTDDGKFFQIINETSFQAAFYEIEEQVKSTLYIFCEDEAAKTVIEKILVVEQLDQYFQVVPMGGAQSILQLYLPTMARGQLQNTYIILDKDQNQHFSLAEDLSSKDCQELKSLVSECYGSEITPYVNGHNREGNKDQLTETYIKYIHLLNSRVFYLPENPEELMLPYAKEDLSSIEDPKDRLKEFAKRSTGQTSADSIRSCYQTLAFQFAKDKDNSNRKDLNDIIRRIWEETQDQSMKGNH